MKNLPRNPNNSSSQKIFTAKVDRLSADGSGVLSYNGEKFFVDGAAPLDTVTARDCGRGRAELLCVEEASPFRVAPACPLFGCCGGCSLQHLSYDAQIDAKVGLLEAAFANIGQCAYPDIETARSAPFGYRNRVQFHRMPNGRYGFKERRGAAVVPVNFCPVADEGINRALAEKRVLPPVEKDRWTVYARRGVFLQEGRNSRGTVEILDRRLALDAGVFFQSNADMLETLINDVVSLAHERDCLTALDLYCGVGTFAAFLRSAGAASVDLVEENKAALDIARQNAATSGGGQFNAEYFAVSTDRWVKNTALKTKKHYDFIIADPPREGLSPAAREWLCGLPAPIFAYVSCNPSSLARDAGILIQSGYALSSLTLYDFYPQTPHIESLAVFILQSV